MNWEDAMRHDQAAAYADALGCAVGSDKAEPDRCAVIVGRRWCWTEPELFAALDARAREQVTPVGVAVEAGGQRRG